MGAEFGAKSRLCGLETVITLRLYAPGKARISQAKASRDFGTLPPSPL